MGSDRRCPRDHHTRASRGLAGGRLRAHRGTRPPSGREADQVRRRPGCRSRPFRVRRGVRSVPRRPLRIPARRARVSLVVVDTDLASTLLRRRTSDTSPDSSPATPSPSPSSPTANSPSGPSSVAGDRAAWRRCGSSSANSSSSPYDQRVATRWGETQAYAPLRGARGRRTTRGSPPAASSASCHLPRSTSRTLPTSLSTRVSHSSTEDTGREMPRGTNHRARQVTGS